LVRRVLLSMLEERATRQPEQAQKHWLTGARFRYARSKGGPVSDAPRA
jgi:hypothetical protein